MGHDDTQPKNRVIFLYTVLTLVALLVLAPIFGSYFTSFVEREIAAKILTVPNAQYEETKQAAFDTLRNGPLPIERAVAIVGSDGRDVSPAIAPSQSDDVAPVEGWMLNKNEEAAARAAEAVERRKAAEAEAAAAEAEGADGESPTGAEGAEPAAGEAAASAGDAEEVEAPFGAAGRN